MLLTCASLDLLWWHRLHDHSRNKEMLARLSAVADGICCELDTLAEIIGSPRVSSASSASDAEAASEADGEPQCPDWVEALGMENENGESWIDSGCSSTNSPAVETAEEKMVMRQT